MSRFDDLRQAVIRSASAFDHDRRMCWGAARAIGDGLKEYLGGGIVRFYKWEEGVNSESVFDKAFVWQDADEPEMIVGISLNIDAGLSYQTLGCGVSLKPKDRSVIASIGGIADDVQLIKDDQNMQFLSDSEKERFLGQMFAWLKKVASTPWHRHSEIDERSTFGFHAIIKQDETNENDNTGTK